MHYLFGLRLFKVVSDVEQEHNKTLQVYFSDINSKASYLIVDEYIDMLF